MAGERLLLVDDEGNLRSMLEAALRYQGFDVHAAAVGAAATSN
jgi:two-component system, OmpR family, response regulator